MKNNASLIYSIFLVIGDFITLLAAFSFAYILRVKYDPRPLIEQIPAETYFYGLAAVLPLWVLVHAFIGLYNRDVYENRFREFGRLIVGSILGILFVIGYDFVIEDRLFPARLVAVYGLLLSLAFLILFRAFARELRAALFSYGIGVNNVLIVGNGPVTAGIIEELEDTHRSGHRILGIVGEPRKGFRSFETFAEAIFKLKNKNLHPINQT
jgi:FlaA1/EpsC-like NDP-sugar epimerase